MIFSEWIDRFLSPDSSDAARRRQGLGWARTVLQETGSLASVIDAPDTMGLELERARRYERELCFVVLEARPDSSGNGEGGPHGAEWFTDLAPSRVISLVAVAGLREVLRASDILCYEPAENRFVLVLVEADPGAAALALSRIADVFHDRLGLAIETGVAHFPHDALTLHDLLDRATEALGAPARESEERRVRPVDLGAGSHGGNGRAGAGNGSSGSVRANRHALGRR